MKRNKRGPGILTRRRPVSSFEEFVATLQEKMCCVSWGDHLVTGKVTVQGDALYILSVLNECICVRLNVVESVVQLDEASVKIATDEWLENLYSGDVPYQAGD